jgi:hypothetical protein
MTGTIPPSVVDGYVRPVRCLDPADTPYLVGGNFDDATEWECDSFTATHPTMALFPDGDGLLSDTFGQKQSELACWWFYTSEPRPSPQFLAVSDLVGPYCLTV